MMEPRMLALFLVLAGWVLAALTSVSSIASLFLPAEHNRLPRLVAPTVALSVFALALYWFQYYEFFPST